MSGESGFEMSQRMAYVKKIEKAQHTLLYMLRKIDFLNISNNV